MSEIFRVILKNVKTRNIVDIAKILYIKPSISALLRIMLAMLEF